MTEKELEQHFEKQVVLTCGVGQRFKNLREMCAHNKMVHMRYAKALKRLKRAQTA